MNLPARIAIEESNGWVIELAPETGEFHVTKKEGEEREAGETFDTLPKARTFVENRKRLADAAAGLKFEPVNMLTDDGTKVVIKGIHAGNGRVLSNAPKNAAGRNYEGDFHPDTPLVADIIAKIARLREQLSAAYDTLAKVKVSQSSWHYRLESAEQHAHMTKKLKDQIARAYDEAAKLQAAYEVGSEINTLKKTA